MKIIEPSATLIEDELAQLSIYQRIAYCAGVCYQREPRKTEEEAQAFCKRMVEIGHRSTLEMATISVVTHPYDYVDSKYVISTEINRTTRVVTGSIRAFMEAEDEYGSHIWNFLAEQYPLFFAESDPPKGHIRFAEPHEIPWQHKHVAVRFIVNRAVSHELVRHRPMSFLQESQRYCRYDDEVVFIRPEWWSDGNLLHQQEWETHMEECEWYYRTKIKQGYSPQQARGGLPNDTKTELIAYASLPQRRHMFSLRCSPAADPEMRRVMIPLREEFNRQYPEMWGEEC